MEELTQTLTFNLVTTFLSSRYFSPFILHSFFSFFLRALSIALVVFVRYLFAFDVSTLLSLYDSNDFMTIPFYCYPLSYSSFTLSDDETRT